MAVEILTVSLSEESMQEIARKVWLLIGKEQAVTQSNPPPPQTTQPAEPQGFQQQAPSPQNGGWTNNPPPQAQQQPQQQYQQGPPQQQDPSAPPPGPAPTCAHGEKKWVPPGFSQNTGKSYRGFYACPAPRGQQCPR